MIREALGLSAGELHLALDAKIHRPGDLVTGTIRLDLSEPSPAKRLVVGLIARQRAVGRAPGQQGLQLSYRNDKVWDFHFDLDGPRRYRPGQTARFELLIPLETDQTNFTPPGGLLGEAAQALSSLSNVKRFPLEWRVYAFLDRPWQLNPKGQVQLQLSAPEPSAVSEPRKRKPTPKRTSKTTKKKKKKKQVKRKR